MTLKTMTSIDVGTDVDWEELMNSFQRIRDYMYRVRESVRERTGENVGEGINGLLLLKSMLDVIHESKGREDESSVRDTGLREATMYQYTRHVTEPGDDLESVNEFYQDVLSEYIMDENRTPEEEEAILPVLMKVVEDNYSSPEFRHSYESRTITDRVLSRALELHESEKQMVGMLGKNVGGLASQYLR